MGRTTGPDEVSSRPKKGDRGRGPRSTQSRSVLISKACSRLLRHQAVNEGIPITSDGWVRLDHLLAWKGLSSRNGMSPPPTIEEMWEVVEENEKKRFAVRQVSKTDENEDQAETGDLATIETTSSSRRKESEAPENSVRKNIQVVAEKVAAADLGAARDDILDQPVTTVQELLTNSPSREKHASTSSAGDAPSANPEVQGDSETAQAIAYYRNSNPPPSAAQFQIRAVQGHSIRTVASDTSLLKPITLDSPEGIPETCVHGTFYGAWPLILKSGGLKRMGRNHVHFASGPSLAEIGISEKGEPIGDRFNRVISGMRRDAQLLIYIDLKHCLQDVREGALEMTWWMSENGVILTEGLEESQTLTTTDTYDIAAGGPKSTQQTTEQTTKQDEPNLDQPSAREAVHASAELEVTGKSHGGRFKTQRSKEAQSTAQSNKIVPLKYWQVVVDAKGGGGIVWERGKGIVNELPERLVLRGNPKAFRGNRGVGRGKGE